MVIPPKLQPLDIVLLVACFASWLCPISLLEKQEQAESNPKVHAA